MPMRSAVFLAAAVAVLALASVSSAKSDGPNIRAVDGALYLDADSGKPVAFRGEDGSYISLQELARNVSMAPSRDEIVAMLEDKLQALEDKLQGNIDDANARIDAANGNGVYFKKLRYVTHKADTSTSQYFGVGTAQTEDVLHVDITDHGCISGVGLSFTVSARHGIHMDGFFPVAASAVRPEHRIQDNNLELMWKMLQPDTYALMLRRGDLGLCNGEANKPHDLTIRVTSSARNFVFDEEGTLAYDASFKPMATVENGYYDRRWNWRAHNTPAPEGVFAVGHVSVDQTLQIEVSDAGCNSGFGTTIFVSATFGVNDNDDYVVASTLPAGGESLAARVALRFKATSASTYMLYAVVQGWEGSCGNNIHYLQISTQTSDPRFDPYGDLAEPYRKGDYKDIKVVSLDAPTSAADLVVSEAFGNAVSGKVETALADELSTDEFYDAIDKHLHRKKIEWSWVTHKPDAAGGTAIPLGLTRVDALLDIKVSDDGCASGLGMDFKLSSPYGVDTVDGRAPRVFALGSYANTNLEDKFQFYWKAKANDQYYLYLRITGWGACNQDTTGRPHFTEVTIETTDAAHDFDDIDTFSDADYAKVQRIDVGRDLVPDGNGNLPLFGNLPFRVIRKIWTGTIEAQTWTKIFTNPGFLPTGGFQVFMPNVKTAYKGGDIWDESYIGEFSWFAGGTNDADQHLEEILLHGSGHANNQQDIKLRTVRNPAPGTLEMQMWSTVKWTKPVTINFIFLQLF